MRPVTITERCRAGRRFSRLHLHFSVFIWAREDLETTQKFQEMQMKHRLCQEKKSKRLFATAKRGLTWLVRCCFVRIRDVFSVHLNWFLDGFYFSKHSWRTNRKNCNISQYPILYSPLKVYVIQIAHSVSNLYWFSWFSRLAALISWINKQQLPLSTASQGQMWYYTNNAPFWSSLVF